VKLVSEVSWSGPTSVACAATTPTEPKPVAGRRTRRAARIRDANLNRLSDFLNFKLEIFIMTFNLPLFEGGYERNQSR
jgi:hypothetical protein